jgi:hypothetical protein
VWFGTYEQKVLTSPFRDFMKVNMPPQESTKQVVRFPDKNIFTMSVTTQSKN